jgi:FeS assembly SUF system regulator
MIRITRQTDYAILLLTYMASHEPERLHTSRSLAEWSGLSVPMVSKILKPLARGSIVQSRRGVKGGHTLSRPADQITIGQIIATIEGPIHMAPCSNETGVCEQESICVVRVNWERISNAVRAAVDSVLLSEMIGEGTLLPTEPNRSAEQRERDLLAIQS